MTKYERLIRQQENLCWIAKRAQDRAEQEEANRCAEEEGIFCTSTSLEVLVSL